MKNAINFYYNLYPDNIHQVQNIYKFNYENEKYYFEPYIRPVDELKAIYELNIQMVRRNVLVHEIILNKKNEAITFVNNIPYILLKVFINENAKISLSDIKFININSGMLEYDNIIKRNDWSKLWISKIDYFEYQITQLGTNYPIIRETFSYYIGLAENAIIYLKTLDPKEEIPLLVTHRRIKYDQSLYDFYNPCNLVIDNITRDIAEYFKEMIINKKDLQNELSELFYSFPLKANEYKLLFARLLFPTFYFDLYEHIIEGNLEEKEIVKVINSYKEYEQFLVKFYLHLRSFMALPEIEWLMAKKEVI